MAIVRNASDAIEDTPSGMSETHRASPARDHSLTTPIPWIKLRVEVSRREIALRIGQGFDAHRFGPGRRLVLAGVEITHPLGLEGHSDADVLTHALIDALLGAAGLGDIGMHFPDTDPQYRGASSIDMLETICRAVDSVGYRISNIDVTVFAQEPRIGPYRAAMVNNIAAACVVAPEQVNVKATTTEGLGFVGRSEGIAAAASVLLEDK